MISMQLSQDHRPIDLGPGLPDYGEQCQWQITEAEKEMGAFVIAVGRMWGPVAADRAAEYWIELVESNTTPQVSDRPNWQRLTIIASSRLALDSRLDTRLRAR